MNLLRISPFPLAQIRSNVIRRTAFIIMFIPVTVISITIYMLFGLSINCGILLINSIRSIPTLYKDMKMYWNKPSLDRWVMFKMVEEKTDE